MTEQFEARLTPSGAAQVIELVGDVDRGSAETLEAAYEAASASGASRVVLDFSRVDYINSTGIAVVVGLLARARQDGRQLSAFGLSDHYRELFEITRISDFIDIVPDLSAALSAPSPGGGT